MFVFWIQITSLNPDAFIGNYGFIASNFSFYDAATFKQIFYSMWLHGGFFHLLSNMWFLHIFGDNVEDAIGHIKYFIFYVVCGVAAVFAQYIFSTQSTVPMIGASGAISGVTGAYFVLFKHSKIEALVPGFVGLWHRVTLPSWFFLGYWFVLQIVSGIGSFSYLDQGGVAFFAHAGGFMAGWFLVRIFR